MYISLSISTIMKVSPLFHTRQHNNNYNTIQPNLFASVFFTPILIEYIHFGVVAEMATSMKASRTSL